MTIRLTTIYILNIFDLIITKHYVNKYGLEFEANPIGKFILSNDYTTIFYKVILVGVLLLIMYFTREKKITKIASWVLLIVFVALTLYHIVGSIIVQKFL